MRPYPIPRRQFLSGTLGVCLSSVGFLEGTIRARESYLPIRVSTLNHVSFACLDLRNSVEWYGRVLGMPVHAFQDYSGGQTVVRIGPGPSYIALSQSKPPRAAELPHFCWGVEDFNIDRLMRALAEVHAPAQAVLREGKTTNGVNFSDPDGFPLQFNPMDACGGGGFLGNVCDASAHVVIPAGGPPPIQVRTLNHVRLMVPDVQRSLDWYQRLTGMPVQMGPDRVGASPRASLRVGAGPQFVALVQGTGPEAYRPHVGFGVENFDADRVMKLLVEHRVTARKIMRGATAELLVEAPDDVEIQLQDVRYCGGSGVLGNQCP